MAFRAVILALILASAASGQLLVPSKEIASTSKAFDQSGQAPLRCSIRPVQPALNFGFRFQTGYVIDVPLDQLPGAGHELRILLRVTPEGHTPSYLTSLETLADVPETKLTGEIKGAFVVGEGAYAVDALVKDERSRTCSGKWRIQARYAGIERELTPAIAPATVQELSAPGVAMPIPAAARDQLTVLIHAAPLAPQASKLSNDDVQRVLTALSSLLEQVQARSVRVIVFSLDQQKVLFKQDGFAAANLGGLTEAIHQLQLGVVDYRTLRNLAHPIDLLGDLLRKESHDATPPDALILLGPQLHSRGDAVSKVEMSSPAPPLFYVQFRSPPSIRIGPAVTRPPLSNFPGVHGEPPPLDRTILFGPDALPDGIEQLVKRWKGETLIVNTPHDYAAAIRRIAGRVRATPTIETKIALPGMRPLETGVEPVPQLNPAPTTPSSPAVDRIPALEPPAGDEDPVEVLMRLRDQVLEHAALIPNHTCVETVRRDRYEPVTGKAPKSCDAILARRKQSDFPQLLRLDATDRLRLDVALSPEREIYSWAGAERFEEGDIDELIPEGAMATGPFASMLLSTFQGRSPRFVFAGDATLDGRRLMEYTFKVPLEESHYRVKAHKEWVVTGYTGTLLVDPRTSELVRLNVSTDELPAAASTCEAHTDLRYGLVPLGGIDYLLPKAARQRFVGRDGSEAENSIAFASCREYRGESTLTFGDKPFRRASAGAAAPLSDPMPAGLPFAVELSTGIAGDQAAAGDRLEGRLVEAIRDARENKTLVPEGARVVGRLMRVETRYSHPELIIAVRWEAIEKNGVQVPFWAMPNRKLQTGGRGGLRQGGLRQGGLRQRGMEIELPLPSESRYGVYHFVGTRDIVPSGFRSEWVTAQP